MYNADAFILAEGSMLDALIEQLPGVELKSNGQIFVKGKKVDNLLLNGKEFFNSDRRLLLDNLGAYTVKNINVYDRLGKDSEFVGRKIGNDSEYVMDVRLKKEYSRGTVMNVEAGGGTSSRWMGRLFAMHFGSRDRYTLYANANNLNDNRKPGQADSWTRGSVQPGEKREEKAGFDYSVEATDKKWDISGNVEGSDERSVLTKDVYQQNFLPQNDTYERMANYSRTNRWAVSTGHNFYTKWKWVNLRVKPSFSYSAGNTLGRIESVTAADESYQDIVNSTQWNNNSRSHNLRTTLDLTSIIKFKSIPDFIELNAGGAYQTEWAEQNKIYSIDYAALGNNESQHQLYKNRPNRYLSGNFSAKYYYSLPGPVSLSLKYGVTYLRDKNTSDMYLVERIAEGTGNEAIKDLYAEIPDLSNSYRSTRQEIGNILTPSLNYNSSNFWIQFNMPIELRHQTLHYERGGQIFNIKRNSPVLGINDTFISWYNSDKTIHTWFRYSLTTDLPSLTSLVDITDNTDPLNIFEGNPSLKNAYNNMVDFSIDFGRKRSHGIGISGGGIANSLVNGYVYDARTGVRRYKTYNVNGDWNISGSIRDAFEFGRGKSMWLQLLTDVTYHNAVDMIGENGIAASKSNVRNLNISENISYEWRFAKHKIGAKVSGMWRHSTSPDNIGFTNINAGDVSYGLTGLFKLPANFEISTDIGANSRFGYNSALVNRTEILWNARISCALDKGRWIIALDGYDLLNQLRNVTYTVNPQGRTEVRTNTLPRYAMLHVQYRLNILP
ncbi:MAG: outer membrane beta-barrel family protein, partial [Muribaculaceae bacterium]|nr:outer membrane beta-barrel family protein [Muribaculaceae bacterium]